MVTGNLSTGLGADGSNSFETFRPHNLEDFIRVQMVNTVGTFNVTR